MNSTPKHQDQAATAETSSSVLAGKLNGMRGELESASNSVGVVTALEGSNQRKVPTKAAKATSSALEAMW